MRPRTKTIRPSVLSDSVRKLREGLGLTQREFARLIGVTTSNVAQWETSRHPALNHLLKIRAITDKGIRPENVTERDWVKWDDTFYSALLQESPIHRLGLGTSISVKAWDIIERLVELHGQVSDHPDIQAVLVSVVSEAEEIQEMARLLNGVSFQLPVGDIDAGDVAEILTPQMLTGMAEYNELSDRAKEKAAHSIAKVLKKRASKRKGDS